MQEQRQISLQIPGDEELLANVLMALFRHALSDIRMREQVANLIRRALDRMGQQPGLLVDDLRRNSSDRRRYHRFLLPERLGYGQSKAFPEALLNHDSGGPLQRIHLDRSRGRKLQYVDVRIARGG